jgi:N-acetylmuramoyl-L-alanine amidase
MIVARHRRFIVASALPAALLAAMLFGERPVVAQDEPNWHELAGLSGTPQIPGLKIVYLHPLGKPAEANKWKYILAHQTEGPAGSAHSGAIAQAANPTRRGVMVWVETDGTVYWATAENAIPTHGDGANRNDNKYVDNSRTYHTVIKTNTVGVEFAGNFPDVTKPPTAEQTRAWLILVRFLQERYGIPAERIYAHNWIDYKDSRYCEGCELATQARKLGYRPTTDAPRSTGSN